MKKHPTPTGKCALRIPDGAVRLDRPQQASGGAWTSFAYSFTEISATASTARVKARRARYENGKLSAESFEGELDRAAYERGLAEAQRRFPEGSARFMRSLFGPWALAGKLPWEWD